MEKKAHEPGRVPSRLMYCGTINSRRATRALTPRSRQRVLAALAAMRLVEIEREASKK